MKTRLMVCLAQLLVDVVGSLSYELTLNIIGQLYPTTGLGLQPAWQTTDSHPIVSAAFRAHTGQRSTLRMTVLTVLHGKSSYQAAGTEEK